MNTRILISEPAGKTVATAGCRHRLDSFDTELIRDHATLRSHQEFKRLPGSSHLARALHLIRSTVYPRDGKRRRNECNIGNDFYARRS